MKRNLRKAVTILIISIMLLTLTGCSSNKEKKETSNNTQDNAFTENNNLKNVRMIKDTEGVEVPVPNGYVESSVEGENTVKTGFVIYEGEEAVNNSNKDTAQKTRNQWVWVPVEDVNEIYGTDSDGKKYGKLYSFSENGKEPRNWTEKNGVMSITKKSSYQEPDIIKYDSAYNVSKEVLTQELEKTIESIKKYGGFYIGRYETGDLSGEAKIVKGNMDINNQTWYTIYEKSKKINGTNNNVRTSMIWGSLWDATLNWLIDSGSKTYSEVGESSKSWGNYGNNTEDGNKSRYATGYSDNWKANNIYDMAGNVWEYTLETDGAYHRVYRGGSYVYGSINPASSRNSSENPTGKHENLR